MSIGTIKKLQPSSLDAEPSELQKLGQLHRILNRGLGDRVNSINFSYKSHEQWPVDKQYDEQASIGDLVVGLLLNPSTLDRTVDHGPPAESKEEAASFRKFWGEKAELRRFKDGSILESLVWSQKDPERPVIHQIIEYLVGRHMFDFEGSISFPGAGFSQMLSKHIRPGQSPLAQFQSTSSSFSALERHIRDIEDLPLQIRQISPASSQLRYTTVNLDNNIDMARSTSEVLIQFEGSGRWPDDLAAIQRTKVAFLLKIGERLRQAVAGLGAKLGLEHDLGPLSNAAFLDVTYPQGESFRLRIHSEREQVLLEGKIKDRTLGPQEQAAATTALISYRRIFQQTPSHTQAVRTLCTRLPILSPTTRLVKKWFAEHLLQPHFCNELIELICIRVFKQPSPWTVPASLQSGFFRTLAFIARWDWRNEPLIVDFGGEMISKDIQAINDRFTSLRKLDPGINRIALLAASNLDPEGLTWTQQGPSKAVAARMTALARAANHAVQEMGLKNLEPERLFVSSTTDYDFVLHLKSRYSGGGRAGKSSSQFKNLSAQSATEVQPSGSIALDFFNELQVGSFLKHHSHSSC
jgi:U3 small nucleolar RNA-associated protein 22